MSKGKNQRSKEHRESKSFSPSSFWTNAGQNPIPAVNTDRPFDFDVGFPDAVARGFDPYYTGSGQYVTTTFSVPDNWCDCAAFDLAVQRLYQTIRENLKSNLSYSLFDLKAYLASVTWLQAICSTINRDFAFLKYRDAQHPTFEHIWGKYAQFDRRKFGLSRQAVQKGTALQKAYLRDEDMATSLTYIDNVLIPKLQLLMLPPAASEFCRWMFDCIYVDEINPSRAQWYWNEIRSIPMFEYDTQAKELKVINHMSTYDMELSDLAEYANYLASTYGVILADLRRCGARMVTPFLQSLSERQPVMKYDDTFFYALRNAYTSGWEPVSGSEQPEFFLVDFYEGMNSTQMCNALSLAGAIASNHELVRPIVTEYQSLLVELDHDTRLFRDPVQIIVQTGAAVRTAYDEVGIHYMSWDTGATSSEVFTNSGSYALTRTLAPAQYFGFNAGSSKWDYNSNWVGEPDSFFQGSISTPVGFATRAGIRELLTFHRAASDFTKVIDSPAFKVYEYNGNAATLYCGDTIVGTNGNTPYKVTFEFEKKVGFMGNLNQPKWLIQIAVEVYKSAANFQAQVELTDIQCLGDIVLGLLDNSNAIIMCDPSVSAFEWILQEVDHHVPVRRTREAYNVTTDESIYVNKELIKETKVSTLYTREELSALLYSLDLSLFMVQGDSRSIRKA